jgi:hypothetical protein
MRMTHTLAIAAVAAAIIALGAKTIVFAPKADATVSQSNTLSVDELHRSVKDLPVLDIKDPI